MTSLVTVEPDADLAQRYRDQRWWTGETLSELLSRALGTGSRTFTVHTRGGSRRMSLQQMDSWARKVAGGLRRIGVLPGDPVAFQLSNGLPAAAVFYGLVHLGAVLVPVGHGAGRAELNHALRASGARVLFVDSADLEAVGGTRNGVAGLEFVIAVGTSVKPPGVLSIEDLADESDEVATVPGDPTAPAVIGWTSGSTAEPKGVLLSHQALCADVRLHMAPLMAARQRPLLSTSPISHVTGMLISLLVPPLVGHDIHLMDFWDAGDVLEIMKRRGLSAGSGAPVFLQSLLGHPECGPEHLRLIDVAALGGASVSAELIRRANALGVTAVRGYGCSEHPSISLGRPTDPIRLRASTDGRLCTGVEVRIRSDDGGHHRTGTGEIITRGPDLFSGYLDPSLNAGAFDQGWYRTGDIGTLDENGYLTVVDRLKDIIIRAGLNVSAAEVENALSTMPEIADVAVVAAPDPRTGEHGCAFIRPAEGYQIPSLTRLREHLAATGLAKYKWPEEIRTHTADFPRTPAGKVLKSALRAIAREPG